MRAAPEQPCPASVLSALVKLLAAKLRQAWPKVRLIVRADSGFCRPAALRRFDNWGVHYIIGLQKNSALLDRVALAELALAQQHQDQGGRHRLIGEFDYAARTWDRPRRVIARLEHDARGANPRFVVTPACAPVAGLEPSTQACVFLTAAQALAP